MRRYLVVANQTLGGEALAEKVRASVVSQPCRFHILVPATPPQEHLTFTEGEANAIAQKRLDMALAQFRELGADVDGEVGVANPLHAIEDVFMREQFDEIILSTLPSGLSRWLKLDLPSRVADKFGLPVTHLVAERESAPSAG
jgi:nucleotide-binding universal stress UspA family protein